MVSPLWRDTRQLWSSVWRVWSQYSNTWESKTCCVSLFILNSQRLQLVKFLLCVTAFNLQLTRNTAAWRLKHQPSSKRPGSSSSSSPRETPQPRSFATGSRRTTCTCSETSWVFHQHALKLDWSFKNDLTQFKCAPLAQSSEASSPSQDLSGIDHHQRVVRCFFGHYFHTKMYKVTIMCA